MPSYTQPADIQRMISPEIAKQLADDDKNGQLEDTIIADAIDRAEGLIDAALTAGGYAAPVALPIPKAARIVVSATMWLAVCDLAARRGVIPEDYRNQCEFYGRILEKIANGELGLPLPTGDINMPHSSTEGQQRKLDITKREIGTGEVRNPDEEHTLDGVNLEG